MSERESCADIESTWLHRTTRPHVAKQLSALFSLRVWLPEGSGEPRPRPQSLTVLVGKCFLPYSRLSLLTRPPLIIVAALAERPQDSSASKWDETKKAICVWTAAKTQVCCSERPRDAAFKDRDVQLFTLWSLCWSTQIQKRGLLMDCWLNWPFEKIRCSWREQMYQGRF